MSEENKKQILKVREFIEKHNVDTVRLGAVDIDGVWRGKQVGAEYFLNRAALDGTQISNILFGWDVADHLVDGLEFTGWDSGYPDIALIPDLSTLSLVPWQEKTASVLCDIQHLNGEPLNLSPRNLLRKAIEKAEQLGYKCHAAYEFEFYLLNDSIASISADQWRSINPVEKSGHCYSMLHHSSSSDIMGEVRKYMRDAGIVLEATNSEHGPGQYEINIKYDDALKAADDAIFVKNGIKEIAAKHGMTATFMAKPNAEWSGSSGHVHMSLSDLAGTPVFANPANPAALSEVGYNFLAGMVALAREFSAIYLPNINSYKRTAGASWAGGNSSWGFDNRTVSHRAITSAGAAARVENRIPGADTNPYLVIAASLLSGLYGIENKLKPKDPILGNAYKVSPELARPLATSLEEATNIFRESEMARVIFPKEFVEHYAQMKVWEIKQSNGFVNNWELARYLDII
ncbi:glutamine synthetase family protein [Pseudomonas knackmussii]|uniref:glutamine synthetase family protein n=1 Tax=Pseudomonas knackmussii TaxID=65741 RepID=UPI003BC51069